MTIRKLALGVMILVLAAVPALAAQEVATEKVWTIEETIKSALESSLTLDTDRKSIEQAQWAKKEARAAFFPTFNLGYSYTRLDEAPSTQVTTSYNYVLVPSTATTGLAYLTPNTKASVTVGSVHNWSLKAKVTQPLFTGFALSTAYKLADLGIDSAKIELAQDILDVVLAAKEAYYSILQAQKGLLVANQAVERVEAHLGEAKSFYDVGMVPKNQVLQAEVTLAEAIQARIRAENGIQLAKANFNMLLRRPLDTPVEVEDIPEHQLFSYDLAGSTAEALANRPELKALAKSKEMAMESVRLAKASYYPTAALVFEQKWPGDSWQVKGENAWSVTAALSWDFWEWGANRDKVQQKRISATKVDNAIAATRDGIALQVKSYYLSLEEARKAIAVAEKSIEQAEENYRMNQERFKEQVATSTDVLDAATLLTNARTSYYNALYKYRLAWAAMERAMGR